MRANLPFIPERDAVAVREHHPCKSAIRTDGGKECKALDMSPISVLPEHRRRGIGEQ